MSSPLAKRIENMLLNSKDDNEILMNLKGLLDVKEIQPRILKDSKTISELFEEKKEMLKHPEKLPKFIKTGYKSLDKVLCGFMLGEYVVIGARPAMGKVQLLVNLSIYISKSTPTLFISLGWYESLIISKFISTISSIQVDKIISNKLTDQELQKVEATNKIISKLDLHFNNSNDYSIGEFRDFCKKQIDEHNIKLIIVDELQLLNLNLGHLNNRELEVNFISKTLKNIAKDFNVCVIAGSQLNDDVESREGLLGKTPRLSDLNEGSSLKHDADRIIFINRPEYYDLTEGGQGNSIANVIEVIIAKNKIGFLGEVYLKRNKNFTSILNKSEREEEEVYYKSLCFGVEE